MKTRIRETEYTQLLLAGWFPEKEILLEGGNFAVVLSRFNDPKKSFIVEKSYPGKGPAMAALKEQAGFKNDGKYAVWGTQSAMPHTLDGVLLVTDNKRDAIEHAKESASQGWTVCARENKFAGYTETVLWTNAI